MRRGQFFIITAVLIAGTLLTLTTMLSSTQTVDYSGVLERYDTEIMENMANEIQSEWWNVSWKYRRNVVVRERNGSFLDNESVAVVLNARRDWVNDDCSDIRPVAGGEPQPWINTTACNVDTYRSDTAAVMRYILDAGSGTVVEDVTGHGHTGSFAGDPSWVSGKFEGGLAFEPGDTVRASDEDSLDFEGIAFTAALWVYLQKDVSGGPKQLFVKGDGRPDGGRNYGMWLNPGGNTIQFRVDPDNQGIASTGEGIDTGRWHHIAGVYQPPEDRLTVYLDGEQVGTEDGITMDADSSNGDNFHLGSSPTNDSATMIVDDFRLYNRSFSASTVEGMAQNGIGVNISADLAPLERETVQVYYSNPSASHPNHTASDLNVTAMEKRPTHSVGSTRGILEVMRKMQERVEAMDASLGANLNLVIRKGCNLLTLRSPRTSLQKALC